METLILVSLLMLLILVLYLWVAPELNDDPFESGRTIVSKGDGSTQSNEKYFQHEKGFSDVASVRRDFSYSVTAFCDPGINPQSTLDLLPNASYQVESAGKGFVRIVVTPIGGAESTSIIMTTQAFQTMADTALRLTKYGAL